MKYFRGAHAFAFLSGNNPPRQIWGAELVPSRLTGWHQCVSRVAFFGNAPRLPADGGAEVVWTFLVLLLIVTWFSMNSKDILMIGASGSSLRDMPINAGRIDYANMSCRVSLQMVDASWGRRAWQRWKRLGLALAIMLASCRTNQEQLPPSFRRWLHWRTRASQGTYSAGSSSAASRSWIESSGF